MGIMKAMIATYEYILPPYDICS